MTSVFLMENPSSPFLREKEMATQSSILAWRTPMDRGAWWATVRRVVKESDTTEGLNNESRGLEGGKGEAVLDEEFLGKASLEASLFHCLYNRSTV